MMSIQQPCVVKIVQGKRGTQVISDIYDHEKLVDPKSTQVVSYPDVSSVNGCQYIRECAEKITGFVVDETSIEIPTLVLSETRDGYAVTTHCMTMSTRPKQPPKLCPTKQEKEEILEIFGDSATEGPVLEILVCGFRELECCLILPYNSSRHSEIYNILVGLKDVLYSFDEEAVWAMKYRFWTKESSMNKSQCVVRKLLFRVMFGAHPFVFNERTVNRLFTSVPSRKTRKRKSDSADSATSLPPVIPPPPDLQPLRIPEGQGLTFEQYTLVSKGVLLFGVNDVMVRVSNSILLSPVDFVDGMRVALQDPRSIIRNNLRETVRIEHATMAVTVSMSNAQDWVEIANTETPVSLGLDGDTCPQGSLLRALALTNMEEIQNMVVFWKGEQPIAGMTPTFFCTGV